MKMKKIFASVAAVAAASALSLSVSAADWSQTGYADNDPSTVNIISTDENGVTFTYGGGAQAKARITLDQILENPDDVSKIYSGSWNLTYNGLSALNNDNIGWLGGGAYVATTNSTGFGLSPNEYDEDGNAIWEDSQTVEDTFKYLLPSSVPTDASASEYVFMDWSGTDLSTYGITITVSDLHLYDADGNEIAQKAYGAGGAAEEAVEEAPAEEVVEEAPAETEAAAEEVVETAPAGDTAATAPVATGNTAVAAIAGIMAVAGAAAVISKRK